MADSIQCGTHVIRNTSLITRSSCITPPSICNPGNQRRDRYAYQHNPVGEVWCALERAADAAAYQVFTAAHPSQQYKMLCTQIRQACESTHTPGELPAEGASVSRLSSKPFSWYDLVLLLETDRSKKPIVDVVSTEVLDCLPDEDVPWVLHELFRSARREVAVTVTTARRTSVLGHANTRVSAPRPKSWWVAQLEAAGRRHPRETLAANRAYAQCLGATSHSGMRRRPSL